MGQCSVLRRRSDLPKVTVRDQAQRLPRTQGSLDHGPSGEAEISLSGAKIRLNGEGNWTVAFHEGGSFPVPTIRFGPRANNAPKRSLRLTSTGALQYSHIASRPAALLSLIKEGFRRFRAVRSNGNATMITGIHLEHCGRMSIKPASSWQSGSAGSRNSDLEIFVPLGHNLGRLTIEGSCALWKDPTSSPLDEREWADMLKIRVPEES